MSMQNSATAISYRGDVKITTIKNGRAIKTNEYRNTGTAPLFSFLGNCLAGNFPVAYNLRPFKLKLLQLKNTAGYATAPTTISPADIEKDCTPFITLSAAPELRVTTNSNNKSSCSVKFSFIIPYTQIDSNTESSIVAIYGLGVKDTNYTDYSAYHILTKEVYSDETLDGSGSNDTLEGSATGVFKIKKLDPIEKAADDLETNKLLAIEWTMTLSNV